MPKLSRFLARPLGAVVVCVTLTSTTLIPAVQAQTREQLYEGFLGELHGAATQYIALGLHYRHDDDCTNRGCVLMGPTDDRDACEEWVKSYNRIDPYDAARCVAATPFLDGQ